MSEVSVSDGREESGRDQEPGSLYCEGGHQWVRAGITQIEDGGHRVVWRCDICPAWTEAGLYKKHRKEPPSVNHRGEQFAALSESRNWRRHEYRLFLVVTILTIVFTLILLVAFGI